MNGWQITLLVILVLMIAAMVALYFLGKRAQKKKDEMDEQLAAASQTVTMLIIDKKRLRITESGLSQQIVAQMPKLSRMRKLPIVKAKVGPKVMSLIADDAIFDEIPIKKEVKATVSGLYITGIRGLRGPIEKPAKKKGFRAKLRDKYNSMSAELKKDNNSKKDAADAPAPKKSKKK